MLRKTKFLTKVLFCFYYLFLFLNFVKFLVYLFLAAPAIECLTSPEPWMETTSWVRMAATDEEVKPQVKQTQCQEQHEKVTQEDKPQKPRPPD